MPDEKPLIPHSLLSLGSFREDIQALLTLSPEQLQVLSALANGRDGFWPSRQTMSFAEQASISLDEAKRTLGVAEYLYERCREYQISPDHAVAQLLDVARALGIEHVAAKDPALRDLVSPKDAYESQRHAASEATGTVAHFQRLDGVWDIRPIFHRHTHEVVARVPVLLINVAWHDMAGTTHEAVFQLDDDDWADFKREADKLDERRRALRPELGEA